MRLWNPWLILLGSGVVEGDGFLCWMTVWECVLEDVSWGLKYWIRTEVVVVGDVDIFDGCVDVFANYDQLYLSDKGLINNKRRDSALKSTSKLVV